MDTAAEVPTVWSQLAENMYLKDSPTAEVWMSERASFRLEGFGAAKDFQKLRVRWLVSVATLLRCN